MPHDQAYLQAEKKIEETLILSECGQGNSYIMIATKGGEHGRR